MLFVNLIGFNLIWFGLVYWGNHFIPIALLFLCAHFYFNRSTAAIESKLIASVAIVGIFVDSILQYTGVFIFTEDRYLPFWLITLWLCFGTTLCHSLKLLSNSIILQYLVGFFIAPLSYLAGQQLNAVSFGMTFLQTYLLLSIVWGFLMVIFFRFKHLLIKTEADYV